MRNIILTIAILISCLFVFAQRSSHVRNGVDTNSVIFKEIYYFWENYQNDLFKKLIIGDTSINTDKYWAFSEIQEYNSPDIILNSPSIYYLLPEYLIGIEKRNDTLYEINSVYFSNYSKNPEIITGFSVFVSKTREGYKLYNAFTINKSVFKEKKWDWLQFYYPDNYEFSDYYAQQLFIRAEKLATDWGLKDINPIKYYLFPTYTEILTSLGIGIGMDDFISVNDVRKRGFALYDSRQIFYTLNGEKLLHEIIHILIQDIRGNYEEIQFDEGVCSYFGEHQGTSFQFHAKRLKIFLNQNPQIDLGINLIEAYLDDNQRYSHESKWKDLSNGEAIWYTDDTTNFVYIIMGEICEIAFKKGGMTLVKKMIIEAQNGEKMYDVIEKNINIKRNEINKYLRNYLNENY
jgi:hypothetical protein